jgi:hypothetical protein
MLAGVLEEGDLDRRCGGGRIVKVNREAAGRAEVAEVGANRSEDAHHWRRRSLASRTTIVLLA